MTNHTPVQSNVVRIARQSQETWNVMSLHNILTMSRPRLCLCRHALFAQWPGASMVDADLHERIIWDGTFRICILAGFHKGRTSLAPVCIFRITFLSSKMNLVIRITSCRHSCLLPSKHCSSPSQEISFLFSFKCYSGSHRALYVILILIFSILELLTKFKDSKCICA
jgi:hypothetical protein